MTSECIILKIPVKNQIFKSPRKGGIGSIVRHPKGYNVYIIDGQYYGLYAGISNHWYWRRINKDGSVGKLKHGYGW